MANFTSYFTIFLYLHVILSTITLGILALALMQAISLKIETNSLKGKNLSVLLKFFPPLATIDRLLFKTLIFGFICLSIAIISGVVSIFLQQQTKNLELLVKNSLYLIPWGIFASVLVNKYHHQQSGIRITKKIILAVVCLFLAFAANSLIKI